MSRASIGLLILAVILVTAPLHAAVSPSAKCAAAKQTAAIKKVAAKMKCFQKAAAKNVPVDTDCLAAAEEKFEGAVAKADKKGGCVRTGDASAIEAAADRCLSDIGNQTPAEPPTCGATAYPECGGSCPAGQQCQALISTRSTDGSGGCDPVHQCGTSCVCRSVATACGGQPCDRICKAEVTCAGQGQTAFTESCCSGDLGVCSGTSAAPVCCCSTSCFHLVNGGGTCQSGLACNESGTASECQ